MEKIKLLLVEDRDVIRDCLKLLLKRSDEIEIVAAAADGLEALFYAQNVKYDVILMDYCMPEMNGFDALKHILEINPDARVIMFSFINNAYEIRELMEEGSYGYINKDSEINVYREAIKAVYNGELFLGTITQSV